MFIESYKNPTQAFLIVIDFFLCLSFATNVYVLIVYAIHYTIFEIFGLSENP